MSQAASVNHRFLLDATCAPSTLIKYKRAVGEFLVWADEYKITVTSVERMDDALTEYFHDLYETNDGAGKGVAAATLYGVQKFMPRIKGQLLTAEMALRGWNRKHPAVSYPPLTWELAVVIAVQLVRHGLLHHGIGVLLAFDCFLRIGELVGLRRSDVADDGDARMGSGHRRMMLRLRQTKTGVNQWVEVESTEVQWLVRQLVRSCATAETKLFGFTAYHFRSRFKDICRELGLLSSYVPHSLRHGGATRWHLQGKSIEDILLRGRWASNKSARRYVQAGRAMLLTVQVPRSIAAVGGTLAANLLQSLSSSLPQSH
jgi:integrase